MASNYLVVFTIGPVQSFIAQARRTQDLYAGSRMLSALTREAYLLFSKKLADAKRTHSLIFPAFVGTTGDPVQSNPNRFAIKVTYDSGKELQELCRKVEEELRKDLFLEPALQSLSTLSKFTKVQQDAKVQLNNHLEVYWAAIALDETTSDYREDYLAIEKYLAATKNLRAFRQSGEAGRKCNVDGIRNALFVKPFTDGREGKRVPAFVQDRYCEIPDTDTRLSHGEGLSALSMYKRIYDKQGDFPSTARIALLEQLADIAKNEDKQAALEAYRQAFPGNWDEQLLYPENISAQYFKKHGLQAKLEEKEGRQVVSPEVQERYEALLRLVGPFTPSYYAIIIFDGDKMGEWFHGKYLEDQKKLFNFQQHLKELLQAYATWALGYLDEPKGRAIYAGGDDFLGLINLHHLFEVLQMLRLKFDEYVNQPLKEEKGKYSIKSDANFSFSAGISIAHYKQPLNTVLEEARKAEKEAKKRKYANQFSIRVVRHSGGTTEAVLPFASTPHTTNVKTVKALAEISASLREQHFSNQFISNLIAETRYWDGASPRALFDVELARLVRRACNITKEDNESKSAYRERKERMIDALVQNISRLSPDNAEQLTDKELGNTIAALRICDFIYRATKNEQHD